MTDLFDLGRFLAAQEDVYWLVREELRAGLKRSHWMWYVFPQLRGLGHSEMSKKYAISSQDEARAYFAHPILGARLRECTGLVLEIQGRTIEQIFPRPDHRKFRSCMTLFLRSVEEGDIFRLALRKYFEEELESPPNSP